MFRTTPLLDLQGLVADLGYEHIELSPREDFMPFFLHPRADRATIARFKTALAGAGVQVSSLLPLYRWSGPDEDDRQAAVRYWKRAIEIAVELGVTVMNSEFNGRPERAQLSEAMFWKSMDELLPIFEREGIQLRLEPHPDDFVEDGRVAADMVRGINSPNVSYLYCAPHTFTWGGDLPGILEYAGDLVTHLHVADSFNHMGSSGLRYITNPPGNAVRVHQHLDIGHGEVPWNSSHHSGPRWSQIRVSYPLERGKRFLHRDRSGSQLLGYDPCREALLSDRVLDHGIFPAACSVDAVKAWVLWLRNRLQLGRRVGAWLSTVRARGVGSSSRM